MCFQKIVVSILFFNFILTYAFLFIVYAFIVRNSPLISQSVNFLLSLNLYISYLFTLYLFVCDCYSLYVVFDHCVEFFVMAHLECYRETETAIFATRTNLPISDFQTWQVWCTVKLRKNLMKCRFITEQA